MEGEGQFQLWHLTGLSCPLGGQSLDLQQSCDVYRVRARAPYTSGMGNLLFNARVRYLNWRLRERKCLSGCGSAAAAVTRFEGGSPVFCSTECRDSWHQTMAEW